MTRKPWAAPWSALAAEAAHLLQHARKRPRWVALIEDEAGGHHSGISLSRPELPAVSLCAEPIALAAFRLRGQGRILRVILIGPPPVGALPPCGRCLQHLIELAPDAVVAWGSARQESGRSPVRLLLPQAFTDYRP